MPSPKASETQVRGRYLVDSFADGESGKCFAFFDSMPRFGPVYSARD